MIDIPLDDSTAYHRGLDRTGKNGLIARLSSEGRKEARAILAQNHGDVADIDAQKAAQIPEGLGPKGFRGAPKVPFSGITLVNLTVSR